MSAKKIAFALLLLTSSASAYFTEYAPLLVEESPSFYDLLLFPKRCPLGNAPELYEAPFPQEFAASLELMQQARAQFAQSVEAERVKANAYRLGSIYFIVERIAAYECRWHAAEGMRKATQAAKQALASADKYVRELKLEVEEKHNSAAGGMLAIAGGTADDVRRGWGTSVGARTNQSREALALAWKDAMEGEWKIRPALSKVSGKNSLLSEAISFALKAREARNALAAELALKQSRFESEYAQGLRLLAYAEREALQEISTDALAFYEAKSVIATKRPATGPAEMFFQSAAALEKASAIAAEGRGEQQLKRTGWLSRASGYYDEARRAASEANYSLHAAFQAALQLHSHLSESAFSEFNKTRAAVANALATNPEEAALANQLLAEARAEYAAIPSKKLGARIEAFLSVKRKLLEATELANARREARNVLREKVRVELQAAAELGEKTLSDGADVSEEINLLKHYKQTLEALGENPPLQALQQLRQSTAKDRESIESRQFLEFEKLRALAGELKEFGEALAPAGAQALEQANAILALPREASAGKLKPVAEAMGKAVSELKTNSGKTLQLLFERAHVRHAFPQTIELDRPARVIVFLEFASNAAIEHSKPIELAHKQLALGGNARLLRASQNIAGVDFERGAVELKEFKPGERYFVEAEGSEVIAKTIEEKNEAKYENGVVKSSVKISFSSSKNALVKVEKILAAKPTHAFFSGSVEGQAVAEREGKFYASALADAAQGRNEVTLYYETKAVEITLKKQPTPQGILLEISARNNAGEEVKGVREEFVERFGCEIKRAAAKNGVQLSFAESTLVIALAEQALSPGEQKTYLVEVECESGATGLNASGDANNFLQNALELKKAAYAAFEPQSELPRMADALVEKAGKASSEEYSRELKNFGDAIASQAGAVEKECAADAPGRECIAVGKASAKARGLASIGLHTEAMRELAQAKQGLEQLVQNREEELLEKKKILDEYEKQRISFEEGRKQFEAAFAGSENDRRKPAEYAKAKAALEALARSRKPLEQALEAIRAGKTTELDKFSPQLLEEKLLESQTKHGVAGDAVQQLAERTEKELEIARSRARQFGGPEDLKQVEAAQENFEQGKFHTALAIASQARDLLPPLRDNGVRPPDWLLAASGIAILSTLAYFLWRKQSAQQEE